MAIAILLLALFLIFTGAVFASFILPRKSAGPFIPSPKNVIRQALRAASLEKGECFYDLGAGTGKALILAEQEFAAQAVGFEIAPFAYFLAQCNLFLHRSHASVRFESLFHANLRDADVVFCFLAERVMPKIEEKLKRELKHGTRVVCFTFGLPHMKPEKEIPVNGPWKILVYRF